MPGTAAAASAARTERAALPLTAFRRSVFTFLQPRQGASRSGGIALARVHKMTLATSELKAPAGAALGAAPLPEQILPLDHPAYTSEVRQGWQGYTRRVCALSTVTAADGVALLRRFLPQATKAWHARQSELHHAQALAHRNAWGELVEEAATATFGRSYQITDYRVSGIACEEFSADHKERLRSHAHSEGKHHTLAVLHCMASGRRHRTALRECELTNS